MFEIVWLTTWTHGRLQCQEESPTVSNLLRIDPMQLTLNFHIEADMFRRCCTKRHSVRPPLALLTQEAQFDLYQEESQQYENLLEWT